MKTETRLTETAAGCDDCPWQPKRGTLAKVRAALRRHAAAHGHATFLLAESCTNYNGRPR